ncbi:hydroxyphenylacetyl-CoA thioesterase PaaI [Plantactinospora sp. GCM10030261]|uniref:hydroxyphenylacetyl-CoA thioesterase PaaI n=1 Tax=Plantactinospora sp. GCM10030261 TaxID=3273420 RepID=UPI00360ECA9F
MTDQDSPDPACRALGIAIEERAPGRARVRMRVTPTMVNLHGLAHGGYLFLLADAAFAYASNAPRGPVTVAQGAQVTFLRPVRMGEELIAEAAVRARSGPSGLYDVTVRRPGGEVVAEFRGHSVALARRPPSVVEEARVPDHCDHGGAA